MQLNLNGYTDVPAGKVVNIATSLQMFEKPSALSPTLNPLIKQIKNADLNQYLKLYRAIGEPWLWFSRLQKSNEELAAILNDANYELYYMGDFGLLELDYREAKTCEIAYLGLLETVINKGFGKALMDFAINKAFEKPISRLWVHSCTLDHPKALDFYQKSGFSIYKRQIEIDDDPRLTGLISSHFGAHFKSIGND